MRFKLRLGTYKLLCLLNTCTNSCKSGVLSHWLRLPMTIRLVQRDLTALLKTNTRAELVQSNRIVSCTPTAVADLGGGGGGGRHRPPLLLHQFIFLVTNLLPLHCNSWPGLLSLQYRALPETKRFGNETMI